MPTPVTTPIATDMTLARFATALEAHVSMQSLVYLHKSQMALTDSIQLYPSVAVYPCEPSVVTDSQDTSVKTVTIPTPDASLIPITPAYFCFELEVAVGDTATAMAAPGAGQGWTWVEPLPESGFAGKTLYIACRLDCEARTVVASCWRMA